MPEMNTIRRFSWARTAWYGAELGVALACLYTLAFIAYAVVRTAFKILTTPEVAGGLAGTVLATWVSLALASIVIAALLVVPVALLGAATALGIRALLAPAGALGRPARAAALGALVCLGISLALVALLAGGLGVAWTPASAATLTFWVVLPLLIYVLAGALASRRLAQLLPARAPQPGGKGQPGVTSSP
jgi:hypothetical protein